ncbi:ABC transporter permease DevC [Thalassococcus sp. S3]|uniref:ABC transporter permease DevC n=1 Tax=Thalassococcus sp. S3 TaxID=2017482 RepID=UPI001024605B|nr:ABC transporter permease DevC [Thalassococcus sp. S3]QBF30766.1 ABC transporter permease [Thalassococcus sp. S3]
MTELLTRLFGWMPVGWLQLTHNRARLASAVAGVAFANVLVFVQLGIMGSMNQAIRDTYRLLSADIMISADDANTFTEGSNVARQWMLTALRDPGISDGTTLFLNTIQWKQAGNDTTLQLISLDINKPQFLNPVLQRKLGPLTLPDTGILDTNTRDMDPGVLAGIRPQSPLVTEIGGRTIRFTDTFDGGVGFTADGYAITSDQTFLRLFPQRVSGSPDQILLKVAPGHLPDDVVERLREALPDTLRVRTFEDAAAEDVRFQNVERPTGLIFGFGVLMGILVGIVIVYQVLSTDVADHLGEYATFKAMGYGPSFFLGVVFEEAIVLAILGFGPGIFISWLAYQTLNAATGLPLLMSLDVAVLVFLGTLAACALSGAVATRRLNAADPADLF